MDPNTSVAVDTSKPSESVVTNSNKRSRVETSSSPEKHLIKLQKLTGDNCGHCNKKCTSRGKFSEALQCDLCYTWVHAQCEGLSKDHYKVINQICNEVPGIAYLCKVNHCCSRFKQLLFFVNSTTTTVPVDTEISDSLNNQEALSNMCNNMKETLQQSIAEISSKIDRLFSSNSDLRMDINSASEQIDISTKTSVNSSSAQHFSSTTPNLSILDELADRERRRKNLIIYNFSENPDLQADRSKFQELSATVFDLNLNMTRVTRLGKRNDEKPRPLLISLENDNERAKILSQSGKLRRHNLYKNVYIAADKTKYEREKHKKLVDELKVRKSNGEKNLVIRNGNIILLAPRSQVSVGQQSSNSSSNSSSSS